MTPRMRSWISPSLLTVGRSVRHTVVVVLTLLLFAFLSGTPGAQSATTLYVAASGNDNWSGKLPQPNAGHTDGPLKTLFRARDLARSLRARGSRSPVTIYLRQAVFELPRPLVLTSEDSETTYEAYAGERPVISGAQPVTGWRPLPAGSAEVAAEAQGHVWMADLPAGWQFNQLFANGYRLRRGALPFSENSDNWFKTVSDGDSVVFFSPGTIADWHDLSSAEVNLMPLPPAFGFKYTYYNTFAPVGERSDDSIQLEQLHEIQAVYGYGVRSRFDIPAGSPFRIENVLAAITIPGQWSIDWKEHHVYCWPPAGIDLNRAQVVAPRNFEIIELLGDEAAGRLVRDVAFRGLTIAYADRRRLDQGEPPYPHTTQGVIGGPDDAAVFMVGVRNITIERCRIVNVGATAIRAILYAQDLVLNRNQIQNSGGPAVSIEGYGLGTHTVNHDHTITGNVMNYIGQLYWGHGGITLDMAGNVRISGNRMGYLSHAGIDILGQAQPRPDVRRIDLSRKFPFGYRWNEIGNDPLTFRSIERFVPGYNVVENNVIHDYCLTDNDAGGIHGMGSHHDIFRNNVVFHAPRDFSFGIYVDADERESLTENNLVYQVPAVPAPKIGASLMVANAPGATVRNNIFAFTGRPFQFVGSHGGHSITHNIFMFSAQVPPPSLLIPSGPGQRSLSSLPGRPFWSFPGQPARSFAPQTGQAAMLGTSMGLGGQNVPFHKSAITTPAYAAGYNGGPSVMDYNLYWSLAGAAPVEQFLARWQQGGWDQHSIVADPGFVDPARGDFNIGSNSPALSIGFKPIATGIRTDQ